MSVSDRQRKISREGERYTQGPDCQIGMCRLQELLALGLWAMGVISAD